MLTFGTDGVRGVANRDLTPELVVALGRAAARSVGIIGSPFLVGRDTRISGPMLQAAITTGITAEGIDVVDVGIIPTPGMARLAVEQNAPAVMISASHNVFSDNGFKFFAAGGLKITDEIEEHLELELRAIVNGQTSLEGAQGLDIGHAGRLAKGPEWYGEGLVEMLGGRSLDGLQVVLDCANGAASRVALQVFEDADADVDIINDKPTGANINDRCGSTHPEGLQQRVVATKADLGLAFDGDADRIIAVDAQGNLIDGDAILAMHALDMRFRGELNKDTVVTTVMSNLGFKHAMAEQGIEVIETQVGDRFVLEALEENDMSLGGEKSGHIIFRDVSTTGDGILTGLLTADLMVRHQKPIAELAAIMTPMPQVLKSVKVERFRDLDNEESIWAEVAKIQGELGTDGRIVLRASGTEPLVRVMVEAETDELANDIVDELIELVEEKLGPA